MRQAVIVQSADIQHRETGRHGWFHIGRIKMPGFRGMLIGFKINLKSFFNVRGQAAHVQQHPVAMGPHYFQTVLLGEISHGLIIGRRRCELVIKLRRGKILVIVRAGRIIDLFQQIGQGFPVAQWQTDGEV